ncbi:alginate O-acetyltransferase [Spirochaetia bacterium]|nr:alginate O-acetyltransferase [Spirochaetia bacterium]
MAFSSITFFVFFAIVLAAMILTKPRKARHIILLIASYVFYGWWDWRFCFLMLVLTIVAYISAVQIEKRQNNRIYIITGVAVPLVILGIFKYFNFFVASFTRIWGISSVGSLNIILPVGISFYTFQSLSYTIDVYRKKITAEKDFFKLALYIAFFPQLVAGPIVRASDFLPQLEEDRNVTVQNFTTGIQIFIFGLFKKIVIADWLSVFVDDVFRTPNAFHAISIILALIAYSIQIYFDFSGYSDMAIGCAKCLGYDFARNFNVPYVSQNITEFWRRWHISLSSWLREYLYIPLGGNRKGAGRTYINNMLTMLLGGLWHGADWTFVVWGGAHGIALCLHKFYRKHFVKTKNASSTGKCSCFFRFVTANLLTNLFVCFCWIFFRADSFLTASQIIARIFTWQTGIIQIYAWVIVAIIIVCAASIVTVLKHHANVSAADDSVQINGFYPILDLSKFWHLVVFFVLIGLIAGLAYTGANPFIYFQF